MRSTLLPLLLFMSVTSFVHAKKLEDAEVRSRFQLISEPICKKVKAREPALPINSVWYERYYLSVDGKIGCQILDVRIDWMTDRPTEFRKYLNSVLYRFNGKKWSKNQVLSYPPKYRIYDKDKKIVYMIVKNDELDFPVDEIVYFTGAWDEERSGEHVVERLRFCEKNQDCYDEYRNVKRAAYLLDPEK
jgi:hypothetical protein